MPPPPPPKTIKLLDVPKFLMERYALEVTRQTVYNWTKRGLRNERLQTTTVKGKLTSRHPEVRVTTAAWIAAFILRCGIPVSAAGDAQLGDQADS